MTFYSWIEARTLSNMRLLIGDSFEESPKYLDIINDFQNTEKPSIIVKSRVVGCTSLLLSYILTKMDEGCNIWYFCFHNNECRNNIEKIQTIVSQYGYTSPTVCSTNMTIKSSFTKGTISFMSVNSNLIDKLRGREAPDIVVYDEMAFFDTVKINELLNLISVFYNTRKDIKEICVSTLSPKGSVFNFIAEIFTPIKINWTDFPDRFGQGTRFVRNTNNVNLYIKINEEDVSNVLSNKNLINTLRKEGWELTSDWRESFKSLTSNEHIRTEIDAETELEYAERNNMMVDEEEDLNLLVDVLDEDKINNFLENDFIYDDNNIWVKSQCECNDICSDWFEIS